MSTKTNDLYPHPFSKAYWRDAVSELKDVHMMVFAALMIALRLVLKQFAIPITPFLKINVSFFITALGGMVFGPVFAAICGGITDVLGFMIKPDGFYFPPFILTEMAGGFVFALYLYRAKVTTTRVMLSRFTINLGVNVIMQTPIMMWYYAVYMNGKQFTLAMAVPGMIKNLAMFPIESVLLTLFLSVMLPITSRLGLTYTGRDAKESLKFTKKQVVSLVMLLIIGVGCVFGYLGYYYKNNSLSASLDQEDTVTIVESAYKKFLSDETTYTVAVYALDRTALEQYDKDLDTIRGMSKSKAKKVAEDGVMTRVSTVTLVLNTKTGDVLQQSIK